MRIGPQTAASALVLLGSLRCWAQPDVVDMVDLHGARVAVVRGASAADCPGQNAILDRVRELLAEGVGAPNGPLEVTATIDAEDAEFVARIVVSGHRQGQRILRATGPGCEELAEALAVSLALILDGTMAQTLEPIDDPVPPAPHDPPVPAASPPPEPREPPPPPVAPVRPSAPAVQRAPLSAWFATGGALTYGIPGDFSGAVTLRGGLEYGRFSLIAGAFGAPTQTFAYAPGAVDVRLLGATFHACGRFVGRSRGLRADACGAVGLGELHGWGRDYVPRREASRPWYALGGGLAARGPIFGPLDWGLAGSLLAPLAKEQFAVTVQTVPRVAYATRDVAFFGGLELWVRFL